VPPGAMTAMSVPARMPGREHHDRGHGRPLPGTETGRVRVRPVRGPLASRWRFSVLPSALRPSTVRMNRVRCHTKVDN
jgi:hypothetical protein